MALAKKHVVEIGELGICMNCQQQKKKKQIKVVVSFTWLFHVEPVNNYH